MTSNYEQIREENIEEYGKGIRHLKYYGELYSDKTHFIFELIQNAEDADASKIEFNIFKDRIEIIHNGKKLFDEKDVRGVCGIGEGSKQSEFTKIGKFGLGFKSVYAYTNTPFIYSGNESFKIEKFVRPFAVEPLKDLDKKFTKLILPFKQEIDKNDAFTEVADKISTLDLKTILFLKNIRFIKWSIDGGKSGTYIKKPLENEQFDIKKVTSISSEEDDTNENWLLFSKPIGTKDLKVELAFKVDYKEKEKEFSIIPANKTELVVFFPTEKETHLKFLIQGPYKTTPNRENVPFNDDWNQNLLIKTSELIQETLLIFKQHKLLNADTLQLFPIDKDEFTEDNVFHLFYEAVKDKILSGKEILPTSNADYVSCHNALIARTKELRDILQSKQISELFQKKSAKWLDENITFNKMALLRRYLLEDIELQEITPDKFANAFTKEFIQCQNDKWVIKFYKFLSKHPELLREKKRCETEGVIRSKSFIRLEDNNHIPPFDENGKLQVFLASNSSHDSMFQIVKKKIIQNPDAKDFLKNLGIKEPNKVASVRQHILQKYRQSVIKVSKEENLKDVEYIKKTIESDKSNDVDGLIEELKNTPFLSASNPCTGKTYWTVPIKIYLGEKYTKSNDLDIYFESNDGVLFLNNHYSILSLEDLRKLGCNDRIIVKYRGHEYSEWNNRITLNDCYGWHTRGLNGFDPECKIDGLEFALKNINVDKSRIIWNYLKKYAKSIKGIVESSGRQEYSDSNREEKVSGMGKLIINHAWLPDKSNKFHKPEELVLSDLPDSFDKESTESLNISQKMLS